ncbi:hypothetical protein HAHE_42050 [Haloferula helveola]|uniref:Sialate O-acetylesterase domain-containing protein n=1 Tax=Haloferula helveola TaxID=490095 RepID=A0ABN6HC51_9BACT|nr:hypothetical protein HAHE_42050 [Haloferula helveola]
MKTHCLPTLVIPFLVQSAIAGVWAHFPFDSDYADVSGNSQNGALIDVDTIGNSGITTSAGDFKFGSGGLDLSADRDYVSFPSKTFSSGTAYSIAFWARKAGGDTGGAAQWDMAIGQRDGTNFFVALNDASGSGGRTGLRWRSSDGTTGRNADFAAADDTDWHHYAIVASGTTITCYVDGGPAQVATGKSTGIILDTIGEAYTAGNDFDFHGQIDEVWIFDHALGELEVEGLFTANDTTAALPERSLHHRYDGDFTDSGPEGRDGTAAGTAALTSDVGEVVFGTGALELDGVYGSQVDVDEFYFLDSEAWSISFWAQRAENGANKGMVIGAATDTQNFLWLNDNFTGLRFRSDGNVTYNFTVPQDTALHHYALVADGTGNLSLFRDGEFVETVNQGDSSFRINSIGQGYTSGLDYTFQGILDEVRVFEGAITPTQIDGLYASNDPDAVQPRTLHHRYDGDYTDASAGGRDGTPVWDALITADPLKVVAGSGALEVDGLYGSQVNFDPMVFLPSEPWSVTFWAQRAELGGQKGMVMGTSTDTRNFIWLNDNFTGLRFRSESGSTYDFTATQDLGLHHYGLVADGTGNLTFYRDGQFVETLNSGDTDFKIECIAQGYTSGLDYTFQGVLDEVRVFDSALIAQDVIDIYDAENPGGGSPVTKVNVFLLGGQSNADGRADPASLPAGLQTPQSDVDFYYKVDGGGSALTTLQPGLSETSQFGPEVTLGRRLADLFGNGPETRTALVKYANGGTNLEVQWAGGGDNTTTGDGPEYVTFQQTVTDGLAALAAAYPGASIEICGMVWLQGESDINGGFHNNYETNLTNFIADVRATYGSDLPFVIIRLSDGQSSLDAGRLATVQAAMDAVAAADPLTSVVNTDSFGVKGDNLHFDAAGQQSIGTAAGEDLVYFKWMFDTFSPAQIGAGAATMSGDGDGDGQSNEDEWVAGTDGADPFSFFAAQIAPATGGFDLSYPTAADRNYSVEEFDPVLETWSEILAPQTGSGGTDTRTVLTGDPLHIYRIRATLP